MLPELFLLGTYAPEKHTGPALWLRCIEEFADFWRRWRGTIRPSIPIAFSSRSIVRGEFSFEVRIRLNVDFHSESLVEDHFQRGIEVTEVVGRNLVRLAGVKQRSRVQTKPNVVKIHRTDERQVLHCNRSFKMLFRVSSGVRKLREPIAQIHTVAQMRKAALGEARFARGPGLRAAKYNLRDRKEDED